MVLVFTPMEDRSRFFALLRIPDFLYSYLLFPSTAADGLLPCIELQLKTLHCLIE